jgi:hypothetical protein
MPTPINNGFIEPAKSNAAAAPGLLARLGARAKGFAMTPARRPRRFRTGSTLGAVSDSGLRSAVELALFDMGTYFWGEDSRLLAALCVPLLRSADLLETP